MISFWWVFVITLILFVIVAGLMSLATFKYYWGVRGEPPVVGEKRRRQKEEELRFRAKQMENSLNNPRVSRKPDFWDNTKNFKE